MGNRIKAKDMSWKDRIYNIGEMIDCKGLCLMDSHGFVLGKSETEELIKGLQILLEMCKEKDIIKIHNAENSKNIKEISEKAHLEARTYKPQRKKRHGYVYIATFDNIRFKIGMSSELDDRITKLSIEMPYELKIIHAIETNDSWLTEQLFHKYFKNKRIKGEWFGLEEKDLFYIRKGKYPKEIMNSIKGVD